MPWLRTYDLAAQQPDLATALSPFTGERVNRFLHIATSADDLVQQNNMQRRNTVIGGAMTDVKGDRSKSPRQQADPDLYVHVTRRTPEGVTIRGAKAHQTGCINSHWLIVMPTLRLEPDDAEYAIAGAVPVDAAGITYVYGRQSCDTRSLEGGDIGQAVCRARTCSRRMHC